jgi:hypothetical protein
LDEPAWLKKIRIKLVPHFTSACNRWLNLMFISLLANSGQIDLQETATSEGEQKPET